MGRFVVTDLTRFSNKKDSVCMAGLTPDGQYCIRPMPYLSHHEYHNLGIRPGVTIEAEFWPERHSEKPHIEDHQYRAGALNVAKEFDGSLLHKILLASAVQTVEDGFEVKAELKHIPLDHQQLPSKSIITLEIDPQHFALQQSYGKVKAEFMDKTGLHRSFIPVTDIGINNHIESAKNPSVAIAELNQYFKLQSSLYLRVGIGREWLNEVDGRNGFWFQINGAYSFPNLHEYINKY